MTDKRDDDEVGYKKPPKQTQWKKGASGNSKGRPKGSKGFKTVMIDALQKLIVVHEDGKPRKMTRFEAVVTRLIMDAMRGKTKAAERILAFAEEHNLIDKTWGPPDDGTAYIPWSKELDERFHEIDREFRLVEADTERNPLKRLKPKDEPPKT